MCRSEASDPLMHPPKEAMPRNSRLRRRQLLLRTLLLPLHLLPRQLQSPMQCEESLGCASAESGPGVRGPALQVCLPPRHHELAKLYGLGGYQNAVHTGIGCRIRRMWRIVFLNPSSLLGKIALP